MIRRSTAIAAVAILLSVILHFFGLSLTSQGQPEQSVEDATTDVVSLGNAFEDVAEALSEPVPPEPAPVPDPPVEKSPEPELAEEPTTEALVASANPQQVFAPDTGSAKVVQPDSAGQSEPEEGTAPEPAIVEPSGGDGGNVAEANVTPPVEPDTVAEVPEGNPDASTAPVEAAAVAPVLRPPITTAPQPDAPQQLAALPAPVAPVLPVTPSPEPAAVPVIPLDRETVDPETPETTVEPAPENSETAEVEDKSGVSELAVVVSPRPRLPDRRPTEEPRGLRNSLTDFSALQVPPSQLIESPLAAYRRGRTDLTFREIGGDISGGLGFGDAGGPGNSDVTNYAGRVLVHLNRAPPVPVSGQGYARVVFEINPDGTLAWVDIIDGTGTREIDRAAKEQIRIAAPFPRPPQGASRKLVFVYRIH